MDIFAHSVAGKPESEWEPLSHHLSQVGQRAAEFASLFGAADMSRAMGLLHDIGKMSKAYQRYIRSASREGGPKGPDHSSAAAKEAEHLYGPQLGRIMAFGLAGHHAGLMDGGGHEGGTLSIRLTKAVEDYTGWEDHVTGLPSAEALRAGFPRFDGNRIDPAFSASFFVRMLFSCLVDADFLATEAFLAQAEGGPKPARGGTITTDHIARVRAHMAAHRRDDTPVNKLRSHILDHANGKAGLPPGLFTLTVPTGGGKTLTSLSFATEHAAAHDLRRVIYVIPFAEAWIETTGSQSAIGPTESPPARRRGSKHTLTGKLNGAYRRLPRGGVDRNHYAMMTVWAVPSRLPRGGVDRNRSYAIIMRGRARRLPRGGVDRNCIDPLQEMPVPVASRAEAWIETPARGTMPKAR